MARIQLQSVAPVSSTNTPGSSGNAFSIFPWAPVAPHNDPISVTAAGVQTPPYIQKFTGGLYGTSSFSFAQDNYSMCYNMFAFFRGSMRFKIVVAYPGGNYDSSKPVYIYINNMINPSIGSFSPNMTQASPVGFSNSLNLGTGPIQPVFDVPYTTSTTLKTSFAYQPGLVESRMVVFPNLEGVIEFEVPFYASGPFCPTNYGINGPVNNRSITVPFPTVTVTGTTNAAGASPTLLGCTLDIFRAVGDDFHFGGLMGCPPHAYWQSGVDPV